MATLGQVEADKASRGQVVECGSWEPVQGVSE